MKRPDTSKWLLLLVILCSVVWMAATTTQLDLTSQVKNTLPVGNGGTGQSSLTAYNVLLGGSSVGFAAPSATSGVPLISNGASANPGFGTAVVAGGGTGQTTLTAHGVVLGEGSSAVNSSAASANGQCFMSAASNYATTDPSFQTCPSSPTFTQGAVTGTCNGSNTSFTLPGTPTNAASLLVFNNGVMLTQGASYDYTWSSGATLTMITAPNSSCWLEAQLH
jgi:hypothetical protein